MDRKAPSTVENLPATIPVAYPRHRAISCAEAKRLDVQASEDFGVPSLVLMEHASRGIAVVVTRLSQPDQRVLVLCGPGNNGGDGYGAARFLQSWGWRPHVLCLARSLPTSGDAFLEYELCRRGTVVEPIYEHPHRLQEHLRAGPNIVVDGIFGSGIDDRALSSPWIDWIDAINSSKAPVVSIDVPSGMQADSGLANPRCIRADVTATMAAPKRGFAENPEFVGRMVEIDIGLPDSLHLPYRLPN